MVKILIGRFRDTELTDQLYYDNQLYFNWFKKYDWPIFENEIYKKNIEDIKEFIKNKPYLIHFGKYKGKTIREIYLNDQKYYNYLKVEALKSYSLFKSSFLIDIIHEFEQIII